MKCCLATVVSASSGVLMTSDAYTYLIQILMMAHGQCLYVTRRSLSIIQKKAKKDASDDFVTSSVQYWALARAIFDIDSLLCARRRDGTGREVMTDTYSSKSNREPGSCCNHIVVTTRSGPARAIDSSGFFTNRRLHGQLCIDYHPTNAVWPRSRSVAAESPPKARIDP